MIIELVIPRSKIGAGGVLACLQSLKIQYSFNTPSAANIMLSGFCAEEILEIENHLLSIREVSTPEIYFITVIVTAI
ncbi:MAG: hypothetical protein V3V30_01320, partial [Parvularculaceae bacterium]